jgi:hypothetical protein
MQLSTTSLPLSFTYLNLCGRKKEGAADVARQISMSRAFEFGTILLLAGLTNLEEKYTGLMPLTS